jgi:putative glutamine amidotransferase
MIIGLTGPSSFTSECMSMIENFLDANFVLLYQNGVSNINHWLGMVDAVVLAGGVDIHPIFYNRSITNNQNYSKFDIDRDKRELHIVDYCLNKAKPMLGICRGHQLIGVAHNMKFISDISDSKICHNPKNSNISVTTKDPLHSVKLIDPEYYYSVYKAPEELEEFKYSKHFKERSKRDLIWVNSFHHQAIAYCNNNPEIYAERNIRVIGTCGANSELSEGKLEIIEAMEGKNWLSVQWHPEFDWKDNTASRVVLNRFSSMIKS